MQQENVCDAGDRRPGGAADRRLHDLLPDGGFAVRVRTRHQDRRDRRQAGRTRRPRAHRRSDRHQAGRRRAAKKKADAERARPAATSPPTCWRGRTLRRRRRRRKRPSHPSRISTSAATLPRRSRWPRCAEHGRARRRGRAGRRRQVPRRPCPGHGRFQAHCRKLRDGACAGRPAGAAGGKPRPRRGLQDQSGALDAPRIRSRPSRSTSTRRPIPSCAAR